jgi:hypothetical protein
MSGGEGHGPSARITGGGEQPGADGWIDSGCGCGCAIVIIRDGVIACGGVDSGMWSRVDSACAVGVVSGRS